MKILPAICLFVFILLNSVYAQRFSMEEISSYPFPSELTASPSGEMIAWAVNEKGLRNIYLAQAPYFKSRKLTDFSEDDGQEITGLQFTPDGSSLIFVRGGEHGSNWDALAGINPGSAAFMPKVEIWRVGVKDASVKKLTEGDSPAISPDGGSIAFIKNSQAWSISIDGGEASPLFETKGNVSSLEWSPDGKSLLFLTNRGTHSIIGIYRNKDEAIQWISPSFNRDYSPRWSPDGKQIAFVRTRGGKPEPMPILEQRHSPWEIRVASVETGESYQRWKSPETLRGSIPTTHGGFNLRWSGDGYLTYLSYEDGWPHLYAIPIEAGPPVQLTKGDFMVEHISLSPNSEFLVFSANTGPDEKDIDRRHVGMVSIKEGKMELLTSGEGIEAIPVVLSDNRNMAFLSADSQRPLLPGVKEIGKETIKLIGEELIPENFPQQYLVTPKQVIFKSADGLNIHGQLFEKEGGPEKKPAVVFVHGGPQRQMLLGWHYGDYYSNTYAINQYLAEMGFVVLSVNFRLGIGYGYEFHKAPRTYWQGAEEYMDVKAAGDFLANLPQVDPERIGIYGGSYGGYLTALALGKDSGLFAAGVDIHGVHDLSSRLQMPDGYEKIPDFDKALKVAWFSSPLAYLDSWKSPVLFIHGDDDRNVQVSHTTDIIRRFQDRGMDFEYLMVPDDSHHWMRFDNLIKINQATADFLKKHLKP